MTTQPSKNPVVVQLENLKEASDADRERTLIALAREAGHMVSIGELAEGGTRILIQVQARRFDLDPGPALAAFEAATEPLPEILQPAPRVPSSSGGLVVRCMADIEPEEVRWLWEPYLPLGKLTILEGDPGDGKTFLSLYLAAAVSTGRPFPPVDGYYGGVRPPGTVLYMTAEDGLADTIRPRLDAAGADASKIHVLEGREVVDHDTGASRVRPFTLQDIADLDEAMRIYCPDLAVLDPVQAYMGGKVDAHRANEVRALLAPLAKLAEKYGTAIVIVRHLGKAGKAHHLYRGLGSIDFAAAARSVILLGRDRRDGAGDDRVVVQTKCSVGAEGPSYGFRIEERCLVWTGVSDATADDLIVKAGGGGTSRREEAESFLLEQLADGPVEAKRIEEAAKAAGVAKGTLRRAKDGLGIDSKKIGQSGGWLWSMPGQDAEGDQSA